MSFYFRVSWNLSVSLHSKVWRVRFRLLRVGSGVFRKSSETGSMGFSTMSEIPRQWQMVASSFCRNPMSAKRSVKLGEIEPLENFVQVRSCCSMKICISAPSSPLTRTAKADHPYADNGLKEQLFHRM